jgi:putative ABC transport system permease protein
MNISLPEATYTPAKRIVFFDQLLQQIRQLPGVSAAGLSTVLPGQESGQDDGYTIHEDPPLPKGKGLDADTRWVDPGYFAAMQIPLKRGRIFTPDERGPRRDYAIISESLARQVFPGRDPIGMHIDDPNNADSPDAKPSSEIIGIVGDVRRTLAEEPAPTIYYPHFGGLRTDGTLAIHTITNPLDSALPVQKLIAGMDPNLAVSDILSLDQVIGKSTLDASFDTTLLLTFAVLSLILAAVGLFGVLSFIVAQRTSEIGIRIALGAQRQQVLRIMLFDGLQPALFGLVIGLAASAATVRLIRSMLYATQPFDPAVFTAVSAALLLVSAVACLLPAWRASRLDPMQALRTE